VGDRRSSRRPEGPMTPFSVRRGVSWQVCLRLIPNPKASRSY